MEEINSKSLVWKKKSGIARKLKSFVLVPVLASGIMMSAPHAKAESPGLSIQPKAIARVYDGGKRPALGAGIDASISRGKTSGGASVSLVMEGKHMKLEEAGLWAFRQAGRFGLLSYIYRDKYYNVDDPAVGGAISGYKLKLGAEQGKGFQDAYLKVLLGDFTPGITAVAWNGNVQKINVSVTTNATEGKVKIATEISFSRLLESKENGLRARITVKF